MIWHDILNPDDPELEQLAKKYNLHPLHIEDVHHRNQAAKVEQQNGYIFVVLKPIQMDDQFELSVGDLDVFVGPDFVITVQEMECGAVCDALARVRVQTQDSRPDKILHQVVDQVVDTYTPLLDRISDRLDDLNDLVLSCPDPPTLQSLFRVKRALIEMRRVFTNTRDVLGHIMRLQGNLIQQDMQPFFRDVYDHVARNVDTIETYRDLLTGSMDVYLSSISNRTNQVMKVLTVISTISLPAIVIAGIYGMNLKHLPWAEHPHAWGIVTGMIFGCSAVLLALLRWFKWL